MRRKIDLNRIYADAVRGMPATIDGLPPLSVPDTGWMTLDELLGDGPVREP
jgi:hypothetical protein